MLQYLIELIKFKTEVVSRVTNVQNNYFDSLKVGDEREKVTKHIA
jgi:hypothetical protein